MKKFISLITVIVTILSFCPATFAIEPFEYTYDFENGIPEFITSATPFLSIVNKTDKNGDEGKVLKITLDSVEKKTFGVKFNVGSDQEGTSEDLPYIVTSMDIFVEQPSGFSNGYATKIGAVYNGGWIDMTNLGTGGNRFNYTPSTGTTLNSGEWYTVSRAYDTVNGSITWYVDGIQIYTTSTVNPNWMPTSPKDKTVPFNMNFEFTPTTTDGVYYLDNISEKVCDASGLPKPAPEMMNYSEGFEGGQIPETFTTTNLKGATLTVDTKATQTNPENKAAKLTVSKDVTNAFQEFGASFGTDVYDAENPIVIAQFNMLIETPISMKGNKLGCAYVGGGWADIAWTGAEGNAFYYSQYQKGADLIQETWNTITRVYNTETGKISFFVNDNPAGSFMTPGASSYGGGDIKGQPIAKAAFQFMPAAGSETDGIYWFDDFTAKRTSYLNFKAVKSEIGTDEDIILKASAPVALADVENSVTVASAKGAVQAVVTLDDSKTVRISIPDGLDMNTEYTVTVADSVVSTEKIPMKAAGEIKVHTQKSDRMYIASYNADKDDDTIIVTDTSVANVSSAPLDGWLVVAAYTADNRMLDAKCVDISQLAASDTFNVPEITLTNVSDAQTVKFMLWDSVNTLVPYHMADTIQF